jgi:hypothetical protein
MTTKCKHGKPVATKSDLDAYDKRGCVGECRCAECRKVCFLSECYRATKPKRKVRKPRYNERAVIMRNGTAQVSCALHYRRDGKALITWVTNWMAWAEQEKSK